MYYVSVICIISLSAYHLKEVSKYHNSQTFLKYPQIPTYSFSEISLRLPNPKTSKIMNFSFIIC